MESTSDNAHAFPDFPAENPAKHELKEWLDVFKDALITGGFGLILRGELPRECVKMVDRIHLAVPGEDGVAKITALSENAKIDAFNEGNKLERESIVREYKARLGARISKALKLKARLRLGMLKEAHKLTMPDGTPIEKVVRWQSDVGRARESCRRRRWRRHGEAAPATC